jgi:AcrR family transcriptional regulator
MTDEKRPYRKTRRADAEAQTRLRITESAVALHGTLGPARTSISAVAEHAGVRRSTVYRHFADEAALFGACSAHWNAGHPPPALDAWAAVGDPDARLRVGLGEMYAYYRGGEAMIANVLRDEAAVPAMAPGVAAMRGYLEAAGATLLRGRRPRTARVRAAVGHALSFTTWRSLVREQGLDDAAAVELMCRLVAAAR